MTPQALDDHDGAVLSPCEMTVLAKDQPQYEPLPVAFPNDGAGKTLGGTPAVSRWKPNVEELAALNAGEDVYLTIYTFNRPHAPVMLTVGCPIFERPVDKADGS